MRQLALWIILATLFMGLATLAQDTVLVISPALEQHLEQIEADTRDIRDLDERTPVERRFPTREALKTYLQAALDKELPPEIAEREAQFYAAFDWLPSGSDLRQLYFDLLSAQVAGYYDPDTRLMNVIPVTGELGEDKLSLVDRITYSHEYTHALQDQHFDLNALDISRPEVTNHDKTLAEQALVEGDATLVMQLYILQVSQDDPFGAAMEILATGLETGGLAFPPTTPQILQAQLLSAYLDGMNFVAALHNDGGWEAVNRTYVELPQSTEQILHPEQYLSSDLPKDVTLQQRDFGTGWTLLIDRTMGEFYLREYLKTQLESSRAKDAAAGWGGDRFRLYYRTETGARAWVMRIVWDTAEDADEFTAAYIEFGNKRFNVVRDGPCWSSADGTLCFITDEAGSLLSFAPTPDMAESLIRGEG